MSAQSNPVWLSNAHREATGHNPFVRAWRGLASEEAASCTVAGEPATLVLWGLVCDGGHKGWVRFPSGEDAIVGGSSVADRRP